MARNLDPKCKQCRREGVKLFLKGERCFTPKCPIVKRNYPPGQHGLKGKTRISGYGLQLREKQKVKRIYRILEAQLRRYFQLASKKRGNTAELLLQLLEMRVDNVLYRCGFAFSRDHARQTVSHGHVTINGKRVNLPSYQLRVGDTVAIHVKRSDAKEYELIKKSEEKKQLPIWLSVDTQNLSGTVTSLPSLDEIQQGIQTQLIVEYYSR
jgi:small subunit ribosomal protein S4